MCRLWKIAISSQNGCGWLAVAFYDSKGRQHFRLSLLVCWAAGLLDCKTAGLTTVGEARSS